MNYSTLTGSTVSAVSTITGNLNYSTLTGSTVNAVSTISGNVNCSTITASTIIISTPVLGDNSTNVPNTAFLQNFIYPQGLFTSLVGTWNSNISATWSANQITLWNASGQPYLARTVSIAINTANGVGTANGLDTGVLAANTWYNVYCMYNGTTVASLFSISATAPTLPSGYTYFSRIGTVYLDGSKNMRGFKQYRNRTQWVVGSNLSGMPIITNAATGNISTPTYTSFSVSTFVPPTAMSIVLVGSSISSASGLTMVAPNNNYGSYVSVSNPSILVYSTALTLHAIILLESSNIFVASQGFGVLCASGYEDNF